MSRKTVRLKAPPGTDEANFGSERFRVDNDGTVEVPAEAAPSLEATGGFVEIVEPVAVPTGMVRVGHDDTAAGCSWGGVSYAREEDGSFHVPAGSVVDLLAHGFTPIEG